MLFSRQNVAALIPLVARFSMIPRQCLIRFALVIATPFYNRVFIMGVMVTYGVSRKKMGCLDVYLTETVYQNGKYIVEKRWVTDDFTYKDVPSPLPP